MIRRRCLLSSPLLLAALLATALASHAQQTLGGITGTVTDPSGSTLPDVEVNALAEDTRLTRNARSNAQGTYTLNDLPIGRTLLPSGTTASRRNASPASSFRLTAL